MSENNNVFKAELWWFIFMLLYKYKSVWLKSRTMLKNVKKNTLTENLTLEDGKENSFL